MKLSDIKGERTLDVIADLIGPVCNIAADKEITLFERKELPKGEDPRTFTLARLREQIPRLLRGHKQDVCEILAAIKGVAVEEYKTQLNLGTLTMDLLELVSDEDFVAFFTSAQTEESASGSAPENTAALEA